MARAGGLAQGDWNEEAEPEGFTGAGMELVDETGETAKPAAVSKPAQVWAPLSATTAVPETKKHEPYRPGGHLAKKQHDGFFPALGAQAPEPSQKPSTESSSNRFTQLQTEDPEPEATPSASSEENKGRKKKKSEWKQVEIQAVVATTQAQQELVTVKESEDMYKPKVTKAYVERQERHSDFPVSETDNVWRKASSEASVPSGYKQAYKRPEESFQRGEDLGPIRREERPEPDLGPWRVQPASSQSTAESEAKEASATPRKFTNTKKKPDEPPTPDSWKAADQPVKPKVNKWALGDPRV